MTMKSHGRVASPLLPRQTVGSSLLGAARPGGAWRTWCFAALALLSAAFLPARAVACEGIAGDITQDGAANAVDVQCAALSVLWVLTQQAAPATAPPTCTQGDPFAADLDCDGVLVVSDVVIAISLALGANLLPAVDANGNGCVDACEPAPAPTCASACGPACCSGESVEPLCPDSDCGGCVCAKAPQCCGDAASPFCAALASLECSEECGCAKLASPISLTEATAAAGLTHTFQTSKNAGPTYRWWFIGGMAAEDFNADGYTDIFVLSGGLSADRLFINKGDGTFEDRADEFGVAKSHYGCGAAAADFDNDGFVDIFVTSFGDTIGQPAALGKNRLYRNIGGTKFVDIASKAQVAKVSANEPCDYGAAFGDYDLDGDLDLFVASWCVGNKPAAGNRLFRNNGAGVFDDVTLSAIGKVYMNVWGFQPTFVDMDGDRYPEILLAADMGTSIYFQNMKDGTFSNETESSGTDIYTWGMGQCVGDFDENGLLDWYLTSIFNPNGTMLPTMHNGNALYLNQGNHLYAEKSQEFGVDDGVWGWGAAAIDLDNDSHLDILAANGRPAAPWTNKPNRLFRSVGAEFFEEIAAQAGMPEVGESMGYVFFDAEMDGDIDFAVLNNHGPLRYYRNDTPLQGNFLHIELHRGDNPRIPSGGYGARVWVTAGGKTQQRFVTGEPSYLSTSTATQYFGLGAAAQVDEVRVEWSRGYETVLTGISVNQKLDIEAPALCDLDSNGVVNAADVALATAAAATPGPVVPLYDVDNNGAVDQGDVALVQSAADENK